MKSKVVLITGALGGIGQAIAKEFAAVGAKLILNYRHTKEDIAVAFANSLSADDYLLARADISNENQVFEMSQNAVAKFGRIDILVNNAGIVLDKEFADRTIGDWNATITTNLIAPFIISQYIGKKMVENKYGKIINMASTNGISSFFPTSIDYDASKAGLISLTQNLAAQFAPFVNVNAIAPGWVNTPMNKGLPSDFIMDESKKISLGRFAEPVEIAKIVKFLASDDASYINGTTIVADGQYR
jgi:3-oxoacyl-[acyl-carrier protein] reductase